MLSSLLLAAEVAKMGGALGAGIAVIGAGLGIGRIGAQAMDAMARQPEKFGSCPRRGCGLLGRDRCALGSSYVINPA